MSASLTFDLLPSLLTVNFTTRMFGSNVLLKVFVWHQFYDLKIFEYVKTMAINQVSLRGINFLISWLTWPSHDQVKGGQFE